MSIAFEFSDCFKNKWKMYYDQMIENIFEWKYDVATYSCMKGLTANMY